MLFHSGFLHQTCVIEFDMSKSFDILKVEFVFWISPVIIIVSASEINTKSAFWKSQR